LWGRIIIDRYPKRKKKGNGSTIAGVLDL
jgi:hypothetical protein